mmetsp:Transcript_15279/g.33666  ORF Transcript_15279/g.33666 Transcript_15279/m.33666 type:complete len:219 (-) Transcript_15279:142-798(-)
MPLGHQKVCLQQGQGQGIYILETTFNRNSFRQFFQLQVQRGHTLTAAAGKEAWQAGMHRKALQLTFHGINLLFHEFRQTTQDQLHRTLRLPCVGTKTIIPTLLFGDFQVLFGVRIPARTEFLPVPLGLFFLFLLLQSFSLNDLPFLHDQLRQLSQVGGMTPDRFPDRGPILCLLLWNEAWQKNGPRHVLRPFIRCEHWHARLSSPHRGEGIIALDQDS